MGESKYSRERLLNTEEAAQYLRVSEASIRRWSDAGVLRVLRVGGRRERRFRQADLDLLLDRSAAADQKANQVTVGGVVVSVPSHLAPFCTSDEGGLRLSVPFLADGLRLDQPCFLVASGEVLNRYRAELERTRHIDVDAMIGSGRLTVVQFEDGTVTDALSQWEQYLSRALVAGPTVIRVVGEMFCEREMFVSEQEMLRYEEAFELMSRRYPVATMCQYDVRHFDGVSLVRALKAHPDMYAYRMGTFLN